jgi:hypothetical protein
MLPANRYDKEGTMNDKLNGFFAGPAAARRKQRGGATRLPLARYWSYPMPGDFCNGFFAGPRAVR